MPIPRRYIRQILRAYDRGSRSASRRSASPRSASPRPAPERSAQGAIARGMIRVLWPRRPR